MGVQIVDCTIRDGGYLLSKNPDSSYVKGIICGLQKAGIDYVETGFLQDQSNGESLVYRCASDMHRVLPAKIEGTEYLGFCDNSRYSIDNLETCDGKTMRWLRISFAKHEMQSALLFADAVQSKGYKVQFNPMDAISYTSAERKALVEAVNHIKPACLSIVDTFGAMYVRDLREIFNQIDGLLDESYRLGYIRMIIWDYLVR
jgi:4-hydroxy 2-oxovalerate aldolase